MAGQVIQEGDDDTALSDINVVPMTDVMLVLLIVFLITIPVVNHRIPVKLPKVAYQPTVTKPENVSLSVRNGSGGTCEVYWELKRMTQKELLDRAVKKLEDQIKAVGGVQNINISAKHSKAVAINNSGPSQVG